MTELARGSCPDCGKDVALRRGDLVREHEDRREPGTGRTCSGSGKPNVCQCSTCAERRTRPLGPDDRGMSPAGTRQ